MPQMDKRYENWLPVTLSGVRAGEGPAVEEVMAACGLHTEDICARILQNTIVARIGSRIIGTVSLEPVGSSGLLRSLAVLEKFRGRGVAGQLVAAAEKSARQMGIQRLYLLTLTAETFFAGKGFEKLERASAPEGIRDTTEFRDLCPDSAVCLRKIIS
jgi:amino-acid N-acetyltransferase